MSSVVLDASALLAFLRAEPGSERVRPVLGSARISAVNLSEVVAKLLDYGRPLAEITDQLVRLRLDVVPFTEDDARLAASLRPATRPAGLSLGDRCCLALGMRLDAPVFTTDRQWATLGLAVVIEPIR